MVYRLALLILTMSLVIACGESTPSQTTPPDQAGVNSWKGEFSLIVGDLTIVPGQTKHSEIIAQLGQPHELERHDISSTTMRGKMLWGCDVSLRETIRYHLEDQLSLKISVNLMPDESDGVVYSAQASGTGNAALGNGTALGDSLSSSIEKLLPHFKSADGIPRLDKYHAWRPTTAPLVGDAEKLTPKHSAADSGTVLDFNNPYRNTIQRAKTYHDPSRTYIRLEPEWSIQSNSDTPDIVSAIAVTLSTDTTYWHKDREAAEHVHWNRLRGRAKNILIQLRNLSIIPSDE